MNLLLRRDGVLLCLGSKCSIMVYSGVRPGTSNNEFKSCFLDLILR